MRWHRVNAGRCLPVLLLGLATASCVTGPWRRAGDFTSRLRCGMTEAEVAVETKRYRQLRLVPSNDPERKLVVGKGRTLVVLSLEPRGVQSHQVSWISGFMKRSYSLKRDLCSGLDLVDIHVVAASSDAGSAVLLDGVKVTELSSFGTASLDVPLGEHRLVVQRPDGSLWTAELAYDKTSRGYDRLVVSSQHAAHAKPATVGQ